MGNRPPSEDELLEEGAALLQRLRKEPVPVTLTSREREYLLRVLGANEHNMDELMSIDAQDELEAAGDRRMYDYVYGPVEEE